VPVGTLAAIPAGSGNDFSVMNGMSEDIAASCHLLAGGKTRLVDLGHLTMDGEATRYFDNNVGIGFDGLVGKETRKFRYIRGLLLYLIVVLKTILLTLRPIASDSSVTAKSGSSTR
jgi:diacylglycerol kinase family enzyme